MTQNYTHVSSSTRLWPCRTILERFNERTYTNKWIKPTIMWKYGTCVCVGGKITQNNLSFFTFFFFFFLWLFIHFVTYLSPWRTCLVSSHPGDDDDLCFELCYVMLCLVIRLSSQASIRLTTFSKYQWSSWFPYLILSDNELKVTIP